MRKSASRLLTSRHRVGITPLFAVPGGTDGEHAARAAIHDPTAMNRQSLVGHALGALLTSPVQHVDDGSAEDGAREALCPDRQAKQRPDARAELRDDVGSQTRLGVQLAHPHERLHRRIRPEPGQQRGEDERDRQQGAEAGCRTRSGAGPRRPGGRARRQPAGDEANDEGDRRDRERWADPATEPLAIAVEGQAPVASRCGACRASRPYWNSVNRPVTTPPSSAVVR